MKNLMELMDEYYEKFGEYFPTMCFQTDTNEEMRAKMARCIKENRPAEDLFDIDDSNEY